MNTRKWILLFICLMISLLDAVTIYDIQYTTVAGNGTYPSLLAGQTVTTQGIVTANGYAGNHGYYISMPEGGAWKGILVYDSGHTPTAGSLIEVAGQAWEFNGMTEIRSITGYQLISAGNPIPPSVVVTTANANTEAYEGVLMEVHNATVTSEVNGYSEWEVSDGSGDIVIADAFFDQESLGSLVTMGVNFNSIKGLGNYSYGIYSINPRSQADVIINSQSVIITLPIMQAPVSQQITIPVNVSNLTLAHNFDSYHFHLDYNPLVMTYSNYSTAGTLSSIGTVMVSPSNGSLNIDFTSNGILQGQGSLLNLLFNTTIDGVSPLTASNFTFNTTPVMIINQGLVTIGISGGETIDTLTVIQRPLLNIPSIVIPGESLNIICVAPPSTTNWSAQLKHGNITADLPVTSAQYLTSPPRWSITATVPNVNVYEMYDLHVAASGGISDRTRHSVHVVPTRKTNYYFAHVTDVHMPSHIFYPNTGYDTDSTETVDFREVIKDINVIRPEFVLLTGDIVNQGPLEEFENMREYSKAKRLLGEFEVPVYLVAGNHDIGGWDSPPLPDGTARKNWWKNFGWSWLDNTSTSWEYHTQDYSFDYGVVHFAGLEAYDNYDGYLYNIYGANSFTNAQMQWLQTDLAASTADTKVLFHHFDYDDELNLTTLGVDMALWGHIHYDSGSITSTPYNLATESTCDGNRAYRIIRVTGSTLQPYNTINAGSSGTQINVIYIPNNYGLADSVYAAVNNNQPLGFENGLIKFNMPSGDTAYTVTGGVLEQVDRSGAQNVCYVRINLSAYSNLAVTIKANNTANEDIYNHVSSLQINAVYPNPFYGSARITLTSHKSTHLKLAIYNLKGEFIRYIYEGKTVSGTSDYSWDGRDASGKQCPVGIYFVQASDGSNSITHKLILIK